MRAVCADALICTTRRHGDQLTAVPFPDSRVAFCSRFSFTVQSARVVVARRLQCGICDMGPNPLAPTHFRNHKEHCVLCPKRGGTYLQVIGLAAGAAVFALGFKYFGPVLGPVRSGEAEPLGRVTPTLPGKAVARLFSSARPLRSRLTKRSPDNVRMVWPRLKPCIVLWHYKMKIAVGCVKCMLCQCFCKKKGRQSCWRWKVWNCKLPKLAPEYKRDSFLENMRVKLKV